MSDVFPSNKNELLANLYMQSQDLSGKSPEELCTIYFDAYSKISKKYDELKSDYSAKRKSLFP